ncbi:MAG: SapC family protein [Nitrosomonadales bacterium]
MEELLFYKELVPLNLEQHRNHSFKKFDNLSFAADAQSVLLTGSEFAEASKEYPILFVKTPDNSMMSVALLGFRQGQNLFVDSSGHWDAHYIPAYVRRYPFVFSEINAEQLVLCFDQGSGRFNTEGDGTRLFDDQGAPSPFVNDILNFLQEYQTDFHRTQVFVNNLQQFDLFKESNAKITLPSGEDFLLNGIWMVDEAKLAALADDKLLQLAKSGELGRIYAHLISLSNISNFTSLDAKRAAKA